MAAETMMNRLAPKSPRTGIVHHGLFHPQRCWPSRHGVDAVIVNAVLPTSAHDLAIPNAGSVWIVNAFQLAATVSLLPPPALGDSLGYRRLARTRPLRAGLVRLRRCSDIACAGRRARRPGTRRGGDHESTSPSPASSVPPRAWDAASASVALVGAVCSAGSPTVAAAILSIASWRWLFLINVPIGAAALVRRSAICRSRRQRSAGSIR